MTQEDLTHYAEQKKRALTLAHNKRFDLNQNRRREGIVTAQIMQEVTGDKGENGKPLYSNELQRKAEAARREDASQDLAEIRIHMQRLEMEITEAEIDVRYFTDMISIGCAFAGQTEMTEA